MARRPDKRTETLLPAGGAGADVVVVLTIAEIAAVRAVATAGRDVLTALGQVTRGGAIDEALSALIGARREVELSPRAAAALALFIERGITIRSALDLHADEALAESGLAKLRAASNR